MTSFKSKTDSARHWRLAHSQNPYVNPFGNVCSHKVDGVPCNMKFDTPWLLQARVISILESGRNRLTFIGFEKIFC